MDGAAGTDGGQPSFTNAAQGWAWTLRPRSRRGTPARHPMPEPRPLAARRDRDGAWPHGPIQASVAAVRA